MTLRRELTPDQDDDAGVTLVELVVYLVVAALVLTAIATLFANAWTSQTQTTNRDAATGAAAAVSASLNQSIRNADDFKVESDGKTVRAIVATGDAGWECRAWTLDPSGSLLYRTSSVVISLGSTVGWAELATGATGTLVNGAAFAAGGTASKQLHIGLTVTKSGQTVPTSGGVTAQAQIPGGGPCW